MKLIEKIYVELDKLNQTIELAIKNELSGDIELGDSAVLQFEIDPWDYRIHLVQTENDILESFELDGSIEAQFENEVEYIYKVVSEQIVPWFAERWKSVNGSDSFSPAYLYFHGGLDSPRYDLEKHNWVSIEQIWPVQNKAQ